MCALIRVFYEGKHGGDISAYCLNRKTYKKHCVFLCIAFYTLCNSERRGMADSDS